MSSIRQSNSAGKRAAEAVYGTSCQPSALVSGGSVLANGELCRGVTGSSSFVPFGAVLGQELNPVLVLATGMT